jgi:hypothetical protein
VRRLHKFVVSALGAVLVLLMLGFGVGSGGVAPDHALVLADAKRGTYTAPPCADGGSRSEFSQISLSEAHKQGLKPERNCVNGGGFVEEGRSVSGQLLESIGLFSPKQRRWNADGTWNF